jgi:hypothetical protein
LRDDFDDCQRTREIEIISMRVWTRATDLIEHSVDRKNLFNQVGKSGLGLPKLQRNGQLIGVSVGYWGGASPNKYRKRFDVGNDTALIETVNGALRDTKGLLKGDEKGDDAGE